MNILKTYKKNRLLVGINLLGLVIGLSVSIMLILFIVNEISYDQHFKNKERIVRLYTVINDKGSVTNSPITLRKAYTELPSNTPEVEAAVQIFDSRCNELLYNNNSYSDLKQYYVDSEFFKVFDVSFIEGSAQDPFNSPKSLIITKKLSDMIFSGTAEAIGKTINIGETDFIVTGVVKEFPQNTHFKFDVLMNLKTMDYLEYLQGLEFYTYYLIKENIPFERASQSIEKQYTNITIPWSLQFNVKATGGVEKITDIYMHSDISSPGKQNSIKFIQLIAGIIAFILILAVSNFINLFTIQGEMRMQEIAIRKTNGAYITDIIRLFFSEVIQIVSIGFILGIILSIMLVPYFSNLIGYNIDLNQLSNPVFICSVIILYIFTVILSATYPAFYLSKFSPLQIFSGQISFSKRKLTLCIIIFQSVITIVLMSAIFLIYKQTSYLKEIPLSYNPDRTVCISTTNNIAKSYESVKQELLKNTDIEQVSCAQHIIGGGWSGQGISTYENKDKQEIINEYRIAPGICELIQLQLEAGSFFEENTPDSVYAIILNESAIRKLGLDNSIVGDYLNYSDRKSLVMGIVKDFYYGNTSEKIDPLALKLNRYPEYIYIKLRNNRNSQSLKTMNSISETLKKFDPNFYMNTSWLTDVYTKKFEKLETQFNLISIGSLLSVIIAILGLTVIHLHTTMRRTREIAIRRINGATTGNIFTLLSGNIIIWIVIAGIIAAPISFYFLNSWLSNFTNKVSVDIFIFIIPVLIQCVIAIAATSGISLNIISKNPVDSLKR